MAEPAKCTGVIDAVNDTVLIGFELIGALPQNFDNYLSTALQSKEVQDAIKDTLLEYAKAHLNNNPTNVVEGEAKKLGADLLSTTGKAFGQSVIGEIKKTPQYKQLEKSAENIGEAFKCSKFGVWVDKKKNILFVVGAGVAVAGAAAMYIARAGDEVTAPVFDLIKDKSVTAKLPGNLNFTAGGFKFEPKKREVGVDLTLAAQWTPVKATFSIVSTEIDSKVQMAGTTRIVIPYNWTNVKIEGTYDPRNPKVAPVQLGMTIEFKHDGLKMDLLGQVHLRNETISSASLGGSLSYAGRFQRVPFSLGVTGKYDTQQKFTGLLTLSVSLPEIK